MDALSRYITDTNIEEEIEPVINVIQMKTGTEYWSYRHKGNMFWRIDITKGETIAKNRWNDVYNDMQNSVAGCKLCVEVNTGHSPTIPLDPLEIPNALFQTIHVDLLKFHGPSRGNG